MPQREGSSHLREQLALICISISSRKVEHDLVFITHLHFEYLPPKQFMVFHILGYWIFLLNIVYDSNIGSVFFLLNVLVFDNVFLF